MLMLLKNVTTNESLPASIKVLDGEKWFFVTNGENNIPLCKVSEKPEELKVEYDFSTEVRKFASQLRQARISQGISTYDIENIYGISRSTLTKLESGKIQNPRIDTLLTLGHILGIVIELRSPSIP